MAKQATIIDQSRLQPDQLEKAVSGSSSPVEKTATPVSTPNAGLRLWRAFASVKITVATIALIAATVLTGAWCPQESQVGQEKIIEQFGPDMALNLIQWGIADIFHTPFFLTLIAVLTLNMVACSCQRVFPKARSLKQPMPFLGNAEIGRLPVCNKLEVIPSRSAQAADQENPSMAGLAKELRRGGYMVRQEGSRLAGEFGKLAKLAATVTHIGLLTLLLGVTITSWTGFSGFQPVRLGDIMSFEHSDHSKLWIGKLPTWRVRVDATRREDYDTGEAKQWYSTLTVLDGNDKVLMKKEISVNEPLSYKGVDIYQSSWALDKIVLSFNGMKRVLQLRPMGKRFAAFLPLDAGTVFIFSVKNQTEPLRLFAKRQDWQSPRMIMELPPGHSTMLGAVKFGFEKVIPATGLQYKSDPGLFITYAAFAFIISGVILAMVPHRLVWASLSGTELALGGRSNKAKVGFERYIDKIVIKLSSNVAPVAPVAAASKES
jgi:cytochrome c biogenesis protein